MKVKSAFFSGLQQVDRNKRSFTYPVWKKRLVIFYHISGWERNFLESLSKCIYESPAGKFYIDQPVKGRGAVSILVNT